MEFGPRAEWLAQAAKDLGRPIPEDAIAPDVPVEFQFAYLAFCALSGDRGSGFAIGPIHFAAIDAYGRRYHVDDIDEFDQFAADIRLIDGIYLEVSKPADKK